MEEKKVSKLTAIKTAVKEKIVNLTAIPLSERNTSTTSKSFKETVITPNKTYTISKAYDLKGETVELPVNTVLQFKDGGSIKNGTLIGCDSIIHADKKIFYDVNVLGTWDCVGNVGWFANGNQVVLSQWGYIFPDMTDQSRDLQFALDSSFRELHFPPKCYYLNKTLVLTKEKKLILHGSGMKLSLEQSSVGKTNNTVIFSDKDICLLRIAVSENLQNTVIIEGGNFDVSRCEKYTGNCIEVLSNEENQRVWGLTINTNVKAIYGNVTGTGININPIENKSLTGNKAYITQVRINSNINNFGTGIKVSDYHNDTLTAYYNWCSDVVIDGSINNCPVAVEGDTDMDIRSMIQAGKFWDKLENGVPLIKYNGILASVSSNIFDIRQQGGKWSNEYALEVTRSDATVTVSGVFESFYRGCKRLGWPVVKGIIRDSSNT